MRLIFKSIVTLPLFFSFISGVLAAATESEQRVMVKNLSDSYPIYVTVFLETTTGTWPFRKQVIDLPKVLPIVELKSGDSTNIFFNDNSVTLVADGQRRTVNINSSQKALLVFSGFSQSLTKVKPTTYTDVLKKKLITQVLLDSIKSGELYADVMVEPGFEQSFSSTLTPAQQSSHVVQVFNEAELKHPQEIKLLNQSDYPIFAAIYQCRMDVGDVTQNKRCARLGGLTNVPPHSSESIADITYDVRAGKYKNEPGNSYFVYLIASRMEDDLSLVRDLRESNMRHVVRSTRRAYNAIYDIIKNSSTSKLWLDANLNGIYIADSYLDFSRVSKGLQDAAVGIASWLHWKDYEKWASPFKNVIKEIAHDPHRFTDSTVREDLSLSQDEQDFLLQRKKETDQAFSKLGIDRANLPVVATCMSGGGFRAMLSSLGFAMGLNEIGVFDTVTYQAGLSGSSWYLSKYMAMAKERRSQNKSHPVNFQKLRADLIERAQKIRYPNFKQQVQVAYMVAPLFKKFVYYQPITPVDLYGVLLGATLLDLGSPNFVNNTFSTFAPVVKDGSVPMPIGTSITKTNAHWFELTPFEVGSAELSAFIKSFSFGRTYRKGIAVNNAPEITLHNAMGFMGSAFALQGFDFLRHLGPNLDFLPSGLGDTLGNLMAMSDSAGLFSAANSLVKDKIGVSFSELINIGKGTADKSIGYWQQLYDSMPYGFVFIAKPELGQGGLGWRSQGAIPAGIVPNPFYLLRDGGKGDQVFAERYAEMRDAGIDFNLPFPPLLRDERKVNVIIAFDASSDIVTNGASALRFAEAYARKHELNYPTITDADFKKASTDNMAVIGDPDDPNALTIIYISLLKNDRLEGKYGQYSPLEDPVTSTFNFSYPKMNSAMLIDAVRKNVVFHKAEILDVLRRKSGMIKDATLDITP